MPQTHSSDPLTANLPQCSNPMMFSRTVGNIQSLFSKKRTPSWEIHTVSCSPYHSHEKTAPPQPALSRVIGIHRAHRCKWRAFHRITAIEIISIRIRLSLSSCKQKSSGLYLEHIRKKPDYREFQINYGFNARPSAREMFKSCRFHSSLVAIALLHLQNKHSPTLRALY